MTTQIPILLKISVSMPYPRPLWLTNYHISWFLNVSILLPQVSQDWEWFDSPVVYLISLLANLNARDNLKAKMGGIHTHISVPLVSIDRTMPSTTIYSPEENHEVCGTSGRIAKFIVTWNYFIPGGKYHPVWQRDWFLLEDIGGHGRPLRRL